MVNLYGLLRMEYPYLSPVRIREVYRDLPFAVRKRWGQNFLIDPNQIRMVVDQITKIPGDILEIGPGLGALTHEILQRDRTVRSIELDPFLCDLLERELASEKRFTLVRGDAREKMVEFPGTAIVCGNLPYYITSELILGASRMPGVRLGVFITQLEFARRAAASDADSSITVFLLNLGGWKMTQTVPSGCFYPEPAVKSAVLVFTPFDSGPQCSPDILERILRMSFRSRRKKISNSWKTSDDPWREKLELSAKMIELNTDLRPEEIPVETYFILTDTLEKLV